MNGGGSQRATHPFKTPLRHLSAYHTVGFVGQPNTYPLPEPLRQDNAMRVSNNCKKDAVPSNSCGIVMR